MKEFKFNPGDRVRKIGGSYQATGEIKSAFRADDGSPRYVFRFDNPPGMLHIFNEGQLERFEPYYKVGMRNDRLVVHKKDSEFLTIYPSPLFENLGTETHYKLKIGVSSCLPVDFYSAEQLITAYAIAFALAKNTWPDAEK